MEKLKFVIKSSETVESSLNKLGKQGVSKPILFVTDESGSILGTLTDGDVRRGLLNGGQLSDPVFSLARKEFKYFRSLDELNEETFKELKSQGVNLVPLINQKGELEKIVDLNAKRAMLPLEAIVMAGGLGTRLKPLTDNTPKPLLEIDGKPIIQYNLERLSLYGINKVNITLRYLGDQIIETIGDGESLGIDIEYVKESEPLGTIGAVGLIQNLKNDAVILMNSDLLTNIDFEDFYKEFIEKNADMAVAVIPFEVNIPYAVLETNEDKLVESFVEKPTYTYYSNAGIYLIKKELLKLIPANTKFDATNFMDELIKCDKNIVVFPIRGYWLDIGKHNDFEKAKKDVAHINW
ncbi:MAG: NTP transferase domain-containing protein [Crocinitomicaceae bacterium]|nr:NTP transferase domain-containing protein [Crocinitomicaceae bacterium]MBT5403522.1 NTP transferase domain-containing protein [Crocinitomicaceae bacterium]MBT6513319.1 NTP transferase domain-containing protein [Crocinitomicaceae bacterium]MDG2329983.1 nucleotidyltransferase family protein [Flavobacteriales bacterium]